MTRLFITPKPAGNSGPAVALGRIMPHLEKFGFIQTPGFWSPWDMALVNLGGREALGVLFRGKPFAFRAAGYFIREIFDRNGRPWHWRYDWANLQTKLFLKRAGRVIFQSEYARQVHTAQVLQATGRATVIHNGVDLEQFRPFSQRGRALPVIGVAGKLRHERAYDLTRVSARLPIPHKLFVVGQTDRVDRAAMTLHAAQRGIELHCPGPVAVRQLPEMYNEIDILVHLAAADVCPNVVVEALACGVPVVCHAYGGTAELVGDGGISVPGSPYRVDDGFIATMAAAIETVWQDHQGYRARARARAEKELDVKAVAARYAAVLDQVRL